MERLTYDFCIGSNHCWQIKGADNFMCKEVCIKQRDNGCTNCPIKKAFDRLAAYENTGLEPEEYKKHADAIKKLDIEHMHSLLQAEMDGRLMVLPCKLGQEAWFLNRSFNNEICPATVVSIELNYHTPASPVWVRVEYRSGAIGKQEYHGRWDLMFGKTVFLTREEAEAALGKREKGG